MLRGNSLKNIKLAHGSDTNVATIGAKASILGIFSFRAVLNLAMLVTESERAKTIRSRMLNIVIDVIAKNPAAAPSLSTSATATICRQPTWKKATASSLPMP